MEKENTIITSLDREDHTVSERRGGDPGWHKFGKYIGNSPGRRAGYDGDHRGIGYIDESDAIDSATDDSEYCDSISEILDSTNDTDSRPGDESDGVQGGGREEVDEWIEGFRNHWEDYRTETDRYAVREEQGPGNTHEVRNRKYIVP